LRERTPFRLREPKKFVNAEPLDFTGILPVRSSVIEDIVPSVVLNLALAQENHAMESLMIGSLAIEQQISRHRWREIAADEVRIEAPQRTRIRELEKGAIVKVGWAERSGPDAKKRGAERGARVLVFRGCIHRRHDRKASRFGPRAIMNAECRAI